MKKIIILLITFTTVMSSLFISPTHIVSAVTYIYGDVTNDGIVSTQDYVCMMNLLNGNLEISSEAQLAKFDLNNNMVVSKVDLQNLIDLLLS